MNLRERNTIFMLILILGSLEGNMGNKCSPEYSSICDPYEIGKNINSSSKNNPEDNKMINPFGGLFP